MRKKYSFNKFIHSKKTHNIHSMNLSIQMKWKLFIQRKYSFKWKMDYRPRLWLWQGWKWWWWWVDTRMWCQNTATEANGVDWKEGGLVSKYGHTDCYGVKGGRRESEGRWQLGGLDSNPIPCNWTVGETDCHLNKQEDQRPKGAYHPIWEEAMVSFAIEGADLHNNVRAAIYFSWQAAPFPVQSKLWSSGFNQPK